MIKFVAISVKLIGLTMMILSMIHSYGLYNFPSAGLSKTSEFLISFLIGLGLLVVPASVIEGILTKKAKDLADKK